MQTAAIQMISTPSLADNLQAAEQLLKQAARQGAELALLPEYFCLMGLQDHDKLGIQECFGQGLIQDFLSRCARELDLWIVGGTLPLSTGNPQRVRNACLVYAPTGQCVARYDKINLFKFDNGREHYDEAQLLEPGTQTVAFDLPSKDGHTYRVGLSICYDLRFAQLYRALDADLLLVPSAFTHTTGQAHWEVLLRARAIENQAYVLAAAQGGVHKNLRHTWGHSMLIDPWGDVLALHEQGAGVVMGTVDKARRLEVQGRFR